MNVPHPLAAIVLLVIICALPAYAKTSLKKISGFDTNALRLASTHAAVSDLKTGRILFTKDADRIVPVASITKLMTAMVVLDSGAPMEEWLTVTDRAQPTPIQGKSRLNRCSQFQRKNLLKIMLMSSENLAAYTLADNHPEGYEAFIAAMNSKATALGMGESHWDNPSGLSVENRATALGLIKMVTAAAKYPAIRELTQTAYYTAILRNPRQVLPFGNSNSLLHRDHWDIRLSKTGYLNAAGQCLVMVVNIDGRETIMVFLNSYGRLSPPGDMRRVAHWMRTGKSKSVARAARAYEKIIAQRYARAEVAAINVAPFIARDAEPPRLKIDHPAWAQLQKQLNTLTPEHPKVPIRGPDNTSRLCAKAES